MSMFLTRRGIHSKGRWPEDWARSCEREGLQGVWVLFFNSAWEELYEHIDKGLSELGFFGLLLYLSMDIILEYTWKVFAKSSRLFYYGVYHRNQNNAKPSLLLNKNNT
jgi:hypothetical protein